MMKIFYALYFTLVAYWLATNMPESQGRWLALCKDVVSLISYNHFSWTGGFDACWLSPFGIDGTCHPLDIPITPTPTIVLNESATHTVSAIAASPVALNLVL
jgi:hypothetical protein